MRQAKVLAIIFLLGSNHAFADSVEKMVIKKFKSYGKQLKSELVLGLKKGPKNAIDVCKKQAPKVAAKVSTDKVKVGRVSHKPRNSTNTTRGWMTASIQDYLSGKKNKGLTKVKIDESKTGYLMPIKTGPVCLTCHGENVAPELRKDILKSYPSDKALGFKAGEIRGFFFAEVSK